MEPLAEALELRRPDQEIHQAITDLYDLGLIDALTVAERNYPTVVLGLTAEGRQELPSG